MVDDADAAACVFEIFIVYIYIRLVWNERALHININIYFVTFIAQQLLLMLIILFIVLTAVGKIFI